MFVRATALRTIGYFGHPDGINILAQQLNIPLTTWGGKPLAEISAESLREIGTPETLAMVEAWQNEE